MITMQQLTSLRVLARDIGFQVHISYEEIRVGDEHGDYVFDNDETGFSAAIVLLRSLKKSEAK